MNPTPAADAGCLAWALWYAAERGFSVFPCRGKQPLTPHGFYDASRNEVQIRAWWTQWPNANIGIPCGTRNQIVVLDVDPRHQGTREGLPPTATVLTGRGDGGCHLYYAASAPHHSHHARQGVDLQGEGVYVIAPPSVHPNTGRTYVWETPPDSPLAPLPSELGGPDPANSTGGKRPGRGARAKPIPDGERHAVLVSNAGAMLQRGMTHEAVAAALRVENAVRSRPEPLPEEELRQIEASAAKWHANPATGARLTEFGNAERFVRQRGNDVRYDSVNAEWRTWDGSRWARDERGEVHWWAQQTIRSIHQEAAEGDTQGALAKWATKSETDRGALALLRVASRHPELVVTPPEWDADPLLFNCANGTLDLRTGALLPFDRHQLLTKQCPYALPAADADPPERWLRFLRRVLPQPGMVTWAQQMAGYCLSGLTGEQCFWLAWGAGDNGKTTMMTVLRRLLGDDYAMQAPDSLLMQHTPGQIPDDIASLPGYRLVVYYELPHRRIDLRVLKSITGEHALRARHLHGRYFEFVPQCKLIITANRKPEIHDTTEAIWRRLWLLPFLVQISKAERVDDYHEVILGEEAPLILRWALAGWLNYRGNGRLSKPLAVEQATKSYRGESDLLVQFIEERCAERAGATTPFADFLHELMAWAAENGVNVRRVSRSWLREECDRHGIVVTAQRGALRVIDVEIPQRTSRTIEID